jgi:hypothetical protein
VTPLVLVTPDYDPTARRYRLWIPDEPEHAGGWRFYAALQRERQRARLAVVPPPSDA